uniref:Uncharacterized protein n=1 Tax=Romanomermis culicivorax TaxID=13658 RepID=A0A915JY45_ROMCU
MANRTPAANLDQPRSELEEIRLLSNKVTDEMTERQINVILPVCILANECTVACKYFEFTPDDIPS